MLLLLRSISALLCGDRPQQNRAVPGMGCSNSDDARKKIDGSLAPTGSFLIEFDVVFVKRSP
jgi:hypothetical protein